MLKITSLQARAWSRLGQRGSLFGIALPELAKDRKDIWVLTADLGLLSGLDRFSREYPERYLNVGIAEQNMMGIAAGLAKEGNCVFVTTYATFITMRSFEQIRNNLGYMRFNVKVVGSAAGLAMGMSGNTHYALEDIALMRAIPNMTILSPADSTEAVKATMAAAQTDGPVYLRLTGEQNCPILYKEDYDFQIGKGVFLQQGEDVSLIATGSMVKKSLEAASLLAESGISATVVDMHTIKPLDIALLDTLCQSHRLLVTVEEHSVIGGLGGAVAEYICSRKERPQQLIIGTLDQFGKAGSYGYLLERHGLTASAIAEKIQNTLQRQN